MDLMLLRGKLSYESGPKMQKVWRRLPSDLVERILEFLPVDVVCRFRCVSKRWNSLTPQVRSSEDGLLVRSWDTARCRSALPQPILVSTLHLPLPEGVVGGLQLCSASRGLICFRDTATCELFVCNPLLRRWKKLPEPDSRFRARCASILTSESNDFYKVFCTGNTFEEDKFIYDSRDGRWKVVGEVPEVLQITLSSEVFFEEHLMYFNWEACGDVALDLETGIYRDCDFWQDRPDFRCFDFEEHRGSLFFVGLDEAAKACSIYKLNKEATDGTREWQHLSRGSLEGLLEESCEHFFPVRIAGFGNYICVSANYRFKVDETTRLPCPAILAYDISNNSWSRWLWDYHQVDMSMPYLISLGLSLSRLP